MACDYQQLRTTTKVLYMVGAGLLILTCILGIASILSFNKESILNVYYALFGAYILASEIGISKLLECCKLLQTFLGKALFCFFLATITFNPPHWYYLVSSIFFFVLCILFIILFIKFRHEEGEQAESAEGDQYKDKEKETDKQKDVGIVDLKQIDPGNLKA